MRSYILIPALTALGWRATVVAAAVASTEIPDVVDGLFPSANSSAPNESLFESDIQSRQLYRAADWASNPHASFPYSHGAGRRSLEVAKHMEGGDWLRRHGLLPAGSPSGVCTRGQGTRGGGGMSGVAGGDKAHGVCSRRGGKLGNGSNGGAAVEGDPPPALVKGGETQVVQSGEVADEGGMEGGDAKEDPRPAEVQGGKTHVASTKAGKTGGSARVTGDPGSAKVQGGEQHVASTKGAKTGGKTKGARVKLGPGPVKIEGSDGGRTSAGVEGEGGSQATKSKVDGVNSKDSKTGEGSAGGESKSVKAPGGGTRGKCDRGGKPKEKMTSERVDKMQRGACSKEAQKGGAKEYRRAAT